MDVVLRHNITSIIIFDNGNMRITKNNIDFYKKIAEDDYDYINIRPYKNYKHYKGDWYVSK